MSKCLQFVMTALMTGSLTSIASDNASASDAATSTVFIPTDFIEDGAAIKLEMPVFKPDHGAAPFPTVVFNHGSTGRGDNPDLFSITNVSQPIARFFNAKGWLVVFPQRRGRGKSGGTYDEGFNPERTRYSISPQRSLAGLERALQDLDAVMDYLGNNPMVRSDQILIGGVSRGGALSIAYAGKRPKLFIGAINFVGGWIGNFSGSGIVRIFYDYMERIHTPTFARGAAFRLPTIWLYGENDSFYSLQHSRMNFDAFIAAGGKGTFHSYYLGKNINGHYLASRVDLWGKDMETFLHSVQ